MWLFAQDRPLAWGHTYLVFRLSLSFLTRHCVGFCHTARANQPNNHTHIPPREHFPAWNPLQSSQTARAAEQLVQPST